MINPEPGRTVFNINHSNILLGLTPKVKQTKAKINRWDLIKLKQALAFTIVLKLPSESSTWDALLLNPLSLLESCLLENFHSLTTLLGQ